MNIELQSCALFVMLVLFIMFFREKRLDLTNRRLFVKALATCFACLVFDILSIININETINHDFYPLITKLSCKIYIMLLVSQGYFGYLYAAADLLPRKHKWVRIVRYAFHGIYATGEIMMLVLPIYYTSEGRKTYSYGPSVLVAYCMAAIYILSTIIISFVYKNKMSARRFVAMIIWQGVWLLAALIQLIFPEILLVGFASAFGMIILYIQLENPSEYIDPDTGAFTIRALSAYVHDKYKHGEYFAMFTAKINYVSAMVDYNMEMNTVRRTARGIEGLGKEPVFRINDEMFGVIYDDEERMLERMCFLKKQKDAVTDVPASATYILFPNSKYFQGPEELFQYMHVHENDEREITMADQDSIALLREKNNIYEMISNALKDDKIEVFYQPFFNTKTQKFTAAEALVRIRDNAGNIVSPGKFIPIAEENGQIIPLGIKIFEKVCQFLATGEPQKNGIETIEINISAAQFTHENPAKFILEYMDKYSVAPELINLEITETAMNDNKHAILANMNKLIENGISFSLDDFGTGRSNLDYFVNMPVKNIKFDYSFTQGYFKNKKIKSVLRGLVDIMHKMNMNIISEGVETREQAEVIKKMGIEYIQGFYYSKPLPKKEFIEFLKENNSGNKQVIVEKIV